MRSPVIYQYRFDSLMDPQHFSLLFPLKYSGLMYADDSRWSHESMNGKTEAYDPILDDDSD